MSQGFKNGVKSILHKRFCSLSRHDNRIPCKTLWYVYKKRVTTEGHCIELIQVLVILEVLVIEAM